MTELFPNRRRSKGRRGARVLLWAALLLLAGEMAARWLRPPAAEIAAVEMRDAASPLHPRLGKFQLDDELAYTPVLGGPEYGSHGALLNDYPGQKRAGVERIVFLGDSATRRAALPDALRAITGDERHEYWNAGVEGYAPAQEVGYYARHAEALAADRVVLLFHINDFETMPIVYVDLFDRLVHLHPAPPRDEVCGFLLRHSYLYRTYLGFEHGVPRPEEREAEVRACLARLKELTDASGAGLEVVLLPFYWPESEWPPQIVQRYDRLLATLSELGIRGYDLRPALRKGIADGIPLRAQAWDFQHPSKEFSALAARELMDRGLLAPRADG